MAILFNAYLAYSYSAGLSKEEQIEIDLKTKKSRDQFQQGFLTGASILVSAYFVYSLSSFIISNSAYALEPTVKPSALNEPKPMFIGATSASQAGDFWLGMACIFGSCIGIAIVALVVKPPKP